MRELILPVLFCAAVILAAAGCEDKLDPVQPPTDSGDNGQGDVVSYSVHIRPILELRCTPCHSSSRQGLERNGAPPGINFDTFSAARAASPKANPRIQSGTMPPGGGIPKEERLLFQSWVDQGTPE